jgi:hypothetical protein
VEEVPTFVRNPFVKRSFNDRFQPFNPSTLTPSDTGLVVHMSKSMSLDFLPVLHLERIS